MFPFGGCVNSVSQRACENTKHSPDVATGLNGCDAAGGSGVKVPRERALNKRAARRRLR